MLDTIHLLGCGESSPCTHLTRYNIKTTQCLQLAIHGRLTTSQPEDSEKEGGGSNWRGEGREGEGWGDKEGGGRGEREGGGMGERDGGGRRGGGRERGVQPQDESMLVVQLL